MTVAAKEQLNLTAPARRRSAQPGVRSRGRDRMQVYLGRVAVLVAFLAAWQYLPKIHSLAHRYRFLDPFFISSPRSVIKATWNYGLGHGGRPLIWPYLWETVSGALEGLAVGMVLGFVLGLLLSSAPRCYDVFGIYINALNSIPRIALVPIIIAVAGTGRGAEVLAVVMSVFFVMFFNCLEGGRRVPPAVLDYARVLQVSPLRTMTRIRIRYVGLWAFAAIPNAAAFSILGVIFVQMLGGTGGIGELMLIATNNLDTTSSISLIVFLSVSGVILVRLGELAKRRLLRWADTQP
jgi:NitT/TauT family transport system permease protein